MRRRLSYQFIVSALLVLAALVSVVLLLTSWMLNDAYDRQIKGETAKSSEFISQAVGTFVAGAYNLTYELAVNPSILTMDGDIQEPILLDCVRRNDYFELLYIQDINGDQTARSSGELTNRRARWWFQQMLDDERPFVSESYYSVFTMKPCTSIYIPMYANGTDGEMIGIFASNIKLTYLQNMIEIFSDYDNGIYSFIIDGKGVVMAHPDNIYLETLTNFKELTRVVSLKDKQGNPVYVPGGNEVATETESFTISEEFNAIISDVMAGANGSSVVEIDGTKWYVGYTPIEIPGNSMSWSVVTLYNRQIAMGISGTVIRNIVIAALIFAAVAVLLFVLIARRVTKPIHEITERANRIANGDLMEAEAFIHDEIAVTTEEVQSLVASIKKMLSELREVESLRVSALEMQHEKEKAEAASETKNRFIAHMSHEIRTPMNAVMGMTELILRKDLPQDVYENAMILKSAGTNLLSIINDILDFTKIESGKLEIVEKEYSLIEMIDDAINAVLVRLIDKPLSFTVDIMPSLPATVTGDEVRMRQILVNLLSNAVKYTPEGQISLDVFGDVREDRVLLTMRVTDSGVGIKEEDIGKLFNDFVQVGMVAGEGTGLGLAISRNLCRMMGGDITVDSVFGQGSIFTVTMQQRIDNYVPLAVVDKPESKAVLLYETREVYRASVAKTLEDLGVRHLSVNSIPALLENADSYEFAFISSYLYGTVMPSLMNRVKPPKVALLSDITETRTPKDARILTIPAHALSIANLLNDVKARRAAARTGVSFTAPGAQVLIVDDVMANLKVCDGLLQAYEIHATLCKTGEEALRLVGENEFDLVFIDHMMPDMDGLEVSMRIRAMDGERFKTLPIVALSANAMSGVREMFLQNGMNDFLAKPIEMSKLNEILERWIPKDKQIVAELVTSSEESEFVAALRELPELAVDKALAAVDNSPEMYEQTVKVAVRSLPDNIRQLEELARTDLPKYVILVHGVKSVLYSIGAFELGGIAAELEAMSRVGGSEIFREIHASFIERASRFTDYVLSIMPEDKSYENKIAGNIVSVIGALPALNAAAIDCEMSAALDTLNALSGFTYGETVDDLLRELTFAFEAFDFNMALEIIQKLQGGVLENE